MWSHRISRVGWQPLIKRTLAVLFLLFLPACATAEIGRRITPEDVAWIQKGVTTRAEIVQRLGPPFSEAPDWTAMQFQSKSITTTSKSGESQESLTTTTVKQVNKLTKALYFYTKSKGGLFVGFTTTQEQFWVRYDERGIVQDYAFEAGPSMTVR